MPIGALSVATAISLLVAVARRSIFFATRILSRLFGILLFISQFFWEQDFWIFVLLPSPFFAESCSQRKISHFEHEPCDVRDRRSLPFSSTHFDDLDAAAVSLQRSISERSIYFVADPRGYNLPWPLIFSNFCFPLSGRDHRDTARHGSS